MKTLKQVSSELQGIHDKIKRRAEMGGTFSKGELRTMRKQVAFLEEVKKYLETNPREAFISKMLANNHKKIESRQAFAEEFYRRVKDPAIRKKLVNAQLKKDGVSTLKKQCDLLSYLLRKT